MSLEYRSDMDGDDAPPETGEQHLNGDPDAKAKAEAKEEARVNSVKGRIKSIYELGEGEWWLADSFKPRAALLRYPGHDRKLMMPRGEVCSLVGSDGIGKSRILTQLCLSIATGQRFLDTYVPEAPGRVLYICGEEDDEEITRRLFYALKDAGMRDKPELIAMIGKNFRSLSQKGRDTRLQEKDLSDSGIAKELQDTIRELAEEEPLALVILDPMSWFAGNDTEKDSIAATQFVRACQRFTEVNGRPTVLVCHHTGKAAQKESADTEDAATTDMRGSSGLSAGFRFGINIVKLKSPKGDHWKDQSVLRLMVKKNNYGPEDHEGIHLRVVHPGVVRAMDPQEVEQFDEAKKLSFAKEKQKLQGAAKKNATNNGRSYGGRRSGEVDDDV